jgi:DNA-directed RNA polymerase subunit RPC12/RpoP
VCAGEEDVYPRLDALLRRLCPCGRRDRDEENHRAAQKCADMATVGMKCPQCGSRHVVSNITIRWNQVKGSFHSERGHFCFRCGRPFQPAQAGEISLRSIRVPEATPAVWSLQGSGDMMVVRYRNGATEILF